jgi:Ohr subfamily peroxiredoxin
MQTLEKVLYTAHATASAGRNGHVETDDKALSVSVIPPKELGGPGGGTNPEQLFAAGYAACFGSAIGAVARRMKVTTGAISVTSHVKFGAVGQGYGLAVELVADIKDVTPEQAQQLLDAAHQVCPYSNATRNNIAVDIKLA